MPRTAGVEYAAECERTGEAKCVRARAARSKERLTKHAINLPVPWAAELDESALARTRPLREVVHDEHDREWPGVSSNR